MHQHFPLAVTGCEDVIVHTCDLRAVLANRTSGIMNSPEDNLISAILAIQDSGDPNSSQFDETDYSYRKIPVCVTDWPGSGPLAANSYGLKANW